MHVLVLGGTRFVGLLLVHRLLARGDRVTLFTRGMTPDPFGARVERLRGDRTTADLATALAGRSFDAAVDFTAYTGADAEGAVAALGNRVGHYVFISTGQVYLVRRGCPRPARESDYDGPVLPRPTDPGDLDQWAYGAGKRDAEDTLLRAHATTGFPVTRIRIPMVNGEGDPSRRLEGYLWRILDGGPVILPGGGKEITRHVYALDVAVTLARILGDARTFGQAYNLCQDEAVPAWDLVGMLAERLGAPDRRVDLPLASLGDLPLRDVSPCSSRWMSYLDPARARGEIGFTHRPLAAYLDSIVASFLAHPPPAPPEGYAQREAERRISAGA